MPVPEGALPGWLGERLAQTLSALLVTLPFSRRAETEADLIGVKLMALAGYDASKAPEAFRVLAGASGGGGRAGGARGRGGVAGGAGRRPPGSDLLASIGCTHPDSTHRADVLEKELVWMARRGQGRLGGGGAEPGRGGGGGGGGSSAAQGEQQQQRHEGLERVGTEVDYWAV